MFHSIYIVGAEPRSGKSIVVLGLMEMLSAMTPKVGFFRPVITENNGRDPLIHLVSKRYNLNVQGNELYGCTLDVARKMIADGRQEELAKMILAKYRVVQDRNDIVVCVGTDFVGANTALELDFNANLANNLGCLFIPVIKGYKRTAGEIADTVRMFEEHLTTGQNSSILAAFVNRVPTAQMDNLDALLEGSRFPYYILPENYSLDRPTVGEIARELHLEYLYGSKQSMTHEVARYKIAAMQLHDFLGHLENCNGNHYTMQLSTYAWMIQKMNPDFIIEKLTLIHYDHSGKVSTHEVEYRKTDVEKVLKDFSKKMIKEQQEQKRKRFEY